MGTVLAAETDDHGSLTGYWIVSVDTTDIRLALLLTEMEVL
ncbi:MAG: hypothetical protein AAFZ80_09680 [Cyanobacteria bacterium P01_A01_bin.105]